ncbi:MAG TPA: hypothetical protein VFM09_14580 [Marmoricola sp.]|nr:hypothetical protein [Marmoricola sp.]
MTHPLGPDAIARLTLDTEPWLSCDDCFRHLDEYVDRLLAGQADPMPAMRVHLTGCPACAEEAATVLELAAEDAGVSPPAL